MQLSLWIFKAENLTILIDSFISTVSATNSKLEIFFVVLRNILILECDHGIFSLGDSWEHCQNDGQDVKELVPELFYLPEMFMVTIELFVT